MKVKLKIIFKVLVVLAIIALFIPLSVYRGEWKGIESITGPVFIIYIARFTVILAFLGDYIATKIISASIEKQNNYYTQIWFRANDIYKGFDTTIFKTFTKKVDDLAKKVMDKEPSIELIPQYALIIEEYKKLRKNEQRVVDFDYEQIKKNLDKAMELKRAYDKVINTHKE